MQDDSAGIKAAADAEGSIFNVALSSAIELTKRAGSSLAKGANNTANGLGAMATGLSPSNITASLSSGLDRIKGAGGDSPSLGQNLAVAPDGPGTQVAAIQPQGQIADKVASLDLKGFDCQDCSADLGQLPPQSFQSQDFTKEQDAGMRMG